ncbi:alpha/beta hydrolase [Anaerosporobacter sp.]
MIGESFGAHLLRSILEERLEQVIGVMFLCPWIPDIEQKLPHREVIIRDEKFLSTINKDEFEGFDYMAVTETEDAYIRFTRDILPGIKLGDGQYMDTLESDIIIDRNVIYEKPALFLMGKQDHVAGYEAAFKLMEQYPRATYTVLDSCGHNAQIERVNLFEVLVSDWLERVNYD